MRLGSRSVAMVAVLALALSMVSAIGLALNPAAAAAGTARTAPAAAVDAPSAAAPTGCGYATGSIGKYADSICWLDFSGYNEAQAHSAAGQPFTLSLGNGYTVSFRLYSKDSGDRSKSKGTGIAAQQYRASVPMAVTSPELTKRSAFAGTYYTTAPGKPVLWNFADANTGPSSNVWLLDDIDVRAADGEPVDAYSFVSGDAEHTTETEDVIFESDTRLRVIETLDSGTNTGCYGDEVSFNSTGTKATCVGRKGGTNQMKEGGHTNTLLASESPTFIQQTVNSDSRNAGVFGFMMTQVELTKSVASRSEATDSFGLEVVSGGSVIASGSTGATATAATVGPVSVLANSTVTLRETGEGDTRLTDYDTAWSCTVNGEPSSAVAPPNGSKSFNLTPTMTNVGDYVACTITNVAKDRRVVMEKTSDWTAEKRVGDTITYRVTATNPGTRPFTATEPATIVDDLSGILDDGTVLPDTVTVRDSTSAQVGSASYTEPKLTWTGPIGAGESITMTVDVLLKGGGDRKLANVAWAVPDEGREIDPTCEDATTDTSVACHVTSLPGLSITKETPGTDTAVEPAVGQLVTYRVTVRNEGPGDFTASNPAVVSDDLSDVLDDAQGGVLASGPLASSGTAPTIDADKVLHWSGPLKAGESVTITYAITYAGGGTNEMVNTACVPTDEVAAGNASCATVTIPGQDIARMTIDKVGTARDVNGDKTIDHRDTVTYTFTLKNTGNVTLSTVGVRDQMLIDAGVAVTCEATALAPSQSTTCTSDPYQVTQADVEAGGIDNHAYGTATPPADVDFTEPEDTARVETGGASLLELTKAATLDGGDANGNGRADIGDTVQYGFSVYNAGSLTVNNLAIDDARLKGANITVTCAPTSLAPGETATCTADSRYTVTEADLVAAVDGFVVNTATATGTDSKGAVTSEQATAKVPTSPVVPTLELVKTASLPAASDLNGNGTYDEGDGVQYTFTVRNRGNVTVESLKITDPLLSGVQVLCNANTLAPGADTECYAFGTYKITQADVVAGSVPNEATVSGTAKDADKTPVSATDTETVTTVPAVASMRLTKTATLTKDGGTTGLADQGDQITYSFVVENTGNVDLSTLQLSDPMLTERGISISACVPATVAPGKTATCATSGAYTVTESDVVAGVVHNEATLTAKSPSGVTDPAPVSDEADVDTVVAVADIALDKKAELAVDANGNKLADAGDRIRYTFTISNLGNVTIDNLELTDARLAGMTLVCESSTLAPKGRAGDSTTCAVKDDALYTVTDADVIAAARTGGFIVNTASVSGSVPNGVDEPTWPTDSAEVPAVSAVPGLTMIKTGTAQDIDEDGKILTGDQVTYEFEVTNNGTLRIDDLVVTDDQRLPGVAITCDTVSLAPGEVARCVAQAPYTITEVDVVAGKVDNVATATGTATDGTPVQATGPDEVKTDAAVGQLVLTKDAVLGTEVADDQRAQVNESIEYSFTVTNVGTVTVRDIRIADQLLTDHGIEIAACVLDGQSVLYPLALAPGQVASCTTTDVLTVSQAQVDAGIDIHNEATASGLDPRDEAVVSNKAVKDVPVAQGERQLVLEKTVTHGNEIADDEVAQAGETLTYGFRITNASNVSVTGLRVDDPALTGWGISVGQCVLEGTDTRVDASTVLAPGAVVLCATSGPRSVDQSDVNAQQDIVNTAQAFVKDPGGDEFGSNESTVTVPVAPAAPVLTLEKLASLPDGVQAEVGTEVTYSFRLINNGNVTLADLAIADPKLVEWGIDVGTCRLDNGAATTTLEPGQAATCATSGPRVVTQADIDAGDPIVNTATATATDPPRNEVPSNESTVTVDLVAREGGLALQKDVGTWTDVNGNGLKDAGDTVTWTFLIENSGNVTIHELRVNDALLSERDVDLSDCEIPELAVGKSVRCESGAYTLTGEDIAAGVLHNEATTSGKTPEGEPIESEMDDADVLLPNIAYRKEVSANASPVVAGTQLTYTVTIQNTGQEAGKVYRQDVLDDVLDDATWVQQPSVTSAPAGNTVTTSSVVDGRFTISGDLPPGEPVVVSYVVEVKPDGQRSAGSSAANFLVDTKDGKPESECVEGATECTVTPLPVLSVAKSSNPESGSAVQPGAVIDYSITLTNDGTAIAPVDLVDDLTHVLDDGDLVVAADGTVFTSSDPAQVDVSDYSEPRLALRGGVAPGETVTVTYQVRVHDTAALGDTVLSNFVLVPSTPTPVDPNSCTSAQVCTVNYAGALVVSKASKASSTPLVAGSTVDYALTFANNGRGAVDVDHVDDLTYVLDDADLVEGTLVLADGLAAERVGDTFVITGSVPAGAISVVSYQVRVVDDAIRDERGGDDLLVNHLLSSGTDIPEPPAPGEECVPTSTSTCHQVAQIDYLKDVTWDGKDQGVPVVAGTVLTYSVTITNSGEGPGTVSRQDLLGDVLDDATVISQPTVTPDNGSVLAGAINNNRFTISGTLGAKETVVVSYQVQVKADAQRADGTQAVNWLVKPGGSVEPGAVCEESDSECTVTALPKLAVSKTSDPEPGSALQPGDTVNYTVTYHNSGTGVAPVDRVDDMTHVLDDATVDLDSFQSSDEAQVVWSYDQDAERLVMTSGTAGGVLPGETVEITYSVTIKPSGQQGDHTLTNYVLSPDQGVPGVGECTAGMVCVTNFSGDLSYRKDADPSATPLLAGDTVTYTLSFTNNSETAPVNVSHVDLLTFVADDAEIGEAIASGDLTVTPASDRFLIGGSVAPGQTETVTYTVTVKADGARGDNMLVNHLLSDPNGGGDVEVPGEPDPNGECTSTTTSTCQEVAQVVYTKTVEADPDTLVDGQIVAGTVLRYSVDIHNIGRGEAKVFRTDDMSDVLDDTELVGQPVSDNPSVTATEVERDAFTMSGTLGTDQRAVVTYAVRVLDELDRKGGNNSADNFLLDAEGESSCEPGDENPECSETALPNMGYQKQAVVDESTLVDGKIVVGTLVHYTVKITNTGQATGVVDREDLLADVLDNAAFAAGGEPVSDVASVLVSPVVDQKFSMSGTLAAQSVAMVTYTVAVLPDVERAGNNTQAANFVVVPGGTPEDSCVENSPCTTTELPLVDYDKSVSAADAPIIDGSVLTYTVTVQNSGTATGWVSREDDLSDVLDEATILTQPTSDNESVRVSAIDEATGRFSISGEIAADTTVTITYKVTIKPGAERVEVDNVANNYVVWPGEPSGPEGCGPDTPCTSTPVPRMVYSKEVVANSTDPLVESGTVLTYRVTATNSGDLESVGEVQRTDLLSDVLDDADLTADPAQTAGPATITVSTVVDEQFFIGGTLNGGESATVEYQVTVRAELDRKDGDRSADNFLVYDPELPVCEDGQVEGCNPPVCVEGSAECTVTGAAWLGYTKDVAVVESTLVDGKIVAGTQLVYTVRIENSGQERGTVAREDLLSDVLDNASFIAGGEPVSDHPDVVASAVVDQKFSMTGTLGAGEVAQVTYTVAVLPDVERAGNNTQAANFVVVPGGTPEDSCVENSPCTTTELPLVDYGKRVDYDAPIVDGSVLTYTVTVTNTGKAAGVVSREDALADVLDEATVVMQPMSDNESVQVSTVDETTGRFSISGEIAAESTVTITYQVKVKPAAERAADAAGNPINNVANNYVVWPGEPSGPEGCGPDTPCTSTPVPRMIYTKSVVADSGPVQTGTVLTYTLTAANAGDPESVGKVERTDVLSDVLDDGEVIAAPAQTEGPNTVTVGEIADEQFSIGGTLTGGQSATVVYQVRILDESERTGGNRTADNFLVLDLDLPVCADGQVEDCNPSVCVEGSTECTVTPVGFVDVVKSVDPESGSSVDAEQTLTYTVRFSNSGQGPATVARVDDLTHVLDDAELDEDSIELTGMAQGQSWSAVFDQASGRIVVDGVLDPEQVVTMTYQVTVKPDGAQGDHVLANFVFRPDVPTPTEPECTEDLVCTVNLTGDVTATKTADPASGTQVRKGEQVSYTLTFTNVGAGTAGVAHTDDLSGVLDDADLVAGPSVSDRALTATVVDGRIRVSGALVAEQTVTVTYTVTVRAAADRGDSQLANFLFADGRNKSDSCVEGSDSCTTHPIAQDVRSGVLAITGASVGVAALLVLVLIGSGWVLVVRTRNRRGAHAA